MTLNLFVNSFTNLKQDCFSFYLIVNLYVKQLNKLNENILKYNENYVIKINLFNNVNDDVKTTLTLRI